MASLLSQQLFGQRVQRVWLRLLLILVRIMFQGLAALWKGLPNDFLVASARKAVEMFISENASLPLWVISNTTTQYYVHPADYHGRPVVSYPDDNHWLPDVILSWHRLADVIVVNIFMCSFYLHYYMRVPSPCRAWLNALPHVYQSWSFTALTQH